MREDVGIRDLAPNDEKVQTNCIHECSSLSCQTCSTVTQDCDDLNEREHDARCESSTHDHNTNQTNVTHNVINESDEKHNLHCNEDKSEENTYTQNKNIFDSNASNAVPASLEHLIAGRSMPADPYDVSDFTPPSWFNADKFKLGQKFAQNYFFCLAYAEMLSLILLFSFKRSVDPLIYSKKSSTPFTAFRRYLSTVNRVRSWYKSDLFDPLSEGCKNMNTVRLMHRSIRQRMNNATLEQMIQRTTIDPNEMCCPLLGSLQDDFRRSIPAPSFGQCPYYDPECKDLRVNQFDMALTQFAFVGLMIIHPDKFGARNASEKELDAFVHLWAVIGYLLGIDDKFNFCINGIDECRKMSSDTINYWFKPTLREVTPEWEHMSRCVVEGIRYYVPENSFETSVFYLSWILDIPVPKLYSAIPWWRRTLFYLQRFLFCVVVQLPGQRAFHNWLLHKRINKALSATESDLRKMQMRSQDFIFKNSNHPLHVTAGHFK